MKTKSICIAAIAALGALSHAQWNQYHGNAQRTGHTSQVLPSSLNLAWTANMGGPIVSSPVIGPDGTIFLGPVQEDTLHPRTVVTAVNPDGTVKWQFGTKFVDTGDPTFSTPAVGADGVLYFGAPDGGFYAVNPDGTQKWKFQGQRQVIQSPAIGPDGRIYVGIDGNLCSFSSDGTVNWQVPIGDARQSGGPAIAPNGTIYEPAGDVVAGSSMVAVSAAGSVLWRTPLNQYFWPLSPPTVGPDGTIYTADQGIHAINPDGTIKWYSEPAYGINGFGSIAVDPSNNLYYSGYIYAWKLDGATGNPLWEYLHTDNQSTLGHGQGGILVDGAGKLFMGIGDGKRSAIPYEKQLLVLSNGGSRLSTFGLPEIAGISAFALGSDGALYIGCLDGKLYAFNVPPRLQGIVTLGEYNGPPAGQQVTVEVRNSGSGAVLETHSATLDSSGRFSVPTSHTGTFDVAIKGSHWLKNVVKSVTFGGGGASGVSGTLVNGDINGDNAVTLADFALVRAAFGSSPGDSNWNASADLNGDGAVTLADFTIVRKHFGEQGG